MRQQREDQGKLNAGLRDTFVARGIAFNEVDQAAFRTRLPGVYATWKEKLGGKCWGLLEAEVGEARLTRRRPLRGCSYPAQCSPTWLLDGDGKAI